MCPVWNIDRQQGADGSPSAPDNMKVRFETMENDLLLHPLYIRISELQTEYNRKKDIGYRYGFELVDDELESLRSELYELNQLYLEV